MVPEMSASVDADTKTLTVQCYCKSIHYTLSLPTSSLPLPTHICHCSVCRYTHGTLCIFHAPLPSGVAPEFVAPSSLDKSTAYTWSGSQSTRYFCSTCGCHMGDVSPDDGSWVISTSLFAKTETVYEIKTHVFTESAPGGGLNDWLPRIGDRDLKIWNAKDGSAAPVESKSETDSEGRERLRAQCHCGGVSFTIPRPTEEVLSDPILKDIVSPVDKSKWIGTLDACDDCRLTSGTHIVPWTFIPLDLCEPKIKPDLLIGTSKTFVSSPGILRSFCGTCGANVFYSYDGRRPNEKQNIVDVSVGILRAPEGVKAEKWLSWRAGSIGWEKDGIRYDADLTKSLGEGFARWSKEKYGDAPDFKIGS
ncbi:glutathione-dependent formaldehyde-activating enzyme [Xylariales sp. AK1849]|nr:glutathione-dependent formaldehyde-activating enzyme [Xylariales sp. AK1849]